MSAREDLLLISVSATLCREARPEPGRFGGAADAIFRIEQNNRKLPLVTGLPTPGFSAQPRARSGDPTALVIGGESFRHDGCFAVFPAAVRTAGAAHPATPLPDRRGRTRRCAALTDHRPVPTHRDPPAALCDGLCASAATLGRRPTAVFIIRCEEPGQGHRTIDLAALAAEAVVLLAPSAEARGVRIENELIKSLPANGEERAVIQILVNLIGNAVRHSPSNGTVTLQFDRTAGIASVIVSDEGPGIAPADQQRIFERFERANADEGGTGLGLAISRRLSARWAANQLEKRADSARA